MHLSYEIHSQMLLERKSVK